MSFDGELNRIDDRLAYGAIDPLPDAFCKRFRFEHLEEAERVVEVVANELGFPKPGPREWRSEYGGFSARRVWAHPEPAYRLFAYCVPILDRALGGAFSLEHVGSDVAATLDRFDLYDLILLRDDLQIGDRHFTSPPARLRDTETAIRNEIATILRERLLRAVKSRPPPRRKGTGESPSRDRDEDRQRRQSAGKLGR
jgi:hypothetical protein